MIKIIKLDQNDLIIKDKRIIQNNHTISQTNAHKKCHTHKIKWFLSWKKKYEKSQN